MLIRQQFIVTGMAERQEPGALYWATLVSVRRGWDVQLPLVEKSPECQLYDIPACVEVE